jgi:hypothetical protein
MSRQHISHFGDTDSEAMTNRIAPTLIILIYLAVVPPVEALVMNYELQLEKGEVVVARENVLIEVFEKI